MDNKVLFVWDFHGVLEKGNVYAAKEACNLMLERFGFDRRISTREAIDWYGLSWFDYFKLALPQEDKELWSKMVDSLFSSREECIRIIKKHIRAREFAEETLKGIKEKGHKNIVISNSRVEHAETYLKIIGLTEYIDKIIGVDTHYESRIDNDIGIIKTETLTNFLKGKKYKKVIVVGDRESDIEAGKKCNATTYFFFDPSINKKPAKTKADYVISDLRETLKEI